MPQHYPTTTMYYLFKNKHLKRNKKQSKDRIQHSMDTKMLSLGYSTNEKFPLSLTQSLFTNKIKTRTCDALWANIYNYKIQVKSFPTLSQLDKFVNDFTAFGREG